jgi:hypothetical protein
LSSSKPKTWMSDVNTMGGFPKPSLVPIHRYPNSSATRDENSLALARRVSIADPARRKIRGTLPRRRSTRQRSVRRVSDWIREMREWRNWQTHQT